MVGIVSLAAASPPTRPAVFMGIGQSLMANSGISNAAAMIASTFAALAGLSVLPEFVDMAVGGSPSCNINDPASAYKSWANLTASGGTVSAGPLLTTALAEIAARIPLGTQPTCFLFDQGQDDNGAAGGSTSGVTPAQAVANYVQSWTYCFAQLQAALPAPVPIIMTIQGRRIGTVPNLGMQLIRQAQINSLAILPNVYRAAEIYDMGLTVDVHPDRSWRAEYGRRQAIQAANALGFATLCNGPSIASCTLSGTTISVAITPETGDTITKTAAPCGFRFEDNSGNILSATWLGWSGNTAQWSLPSVPSGIHCNFIDDTMQDFNPKLLIKGTASGLPLRSFYS